MDLFSTARVPRVMALLVLVGLFPGCPGVRHTAEWHQEQGDAAYQRGQFAEAERQFTAAIQEAERPGQPPQMLSRNLSRLADLYRVEKKTAQAEELYRRILEVHVHTQGPEHPDVAWDLIRLGEIYHEQGLYKQAIEAYVRAFSIWGKSSRHEEAQIVTATKDITEACQAVGGCPFLDILLQATREWSRNSIQSEGKNAEFWGPSLILHKGKISAYDVGLANRKVVFIRSEGEKIGEAHRLFVKQSDAELEGQSPVLIRESDGKIFDEHIAIAENGTIVAIWKEYSTDDVDVWGADYTVEGGWTPATRIESRSGAVDQLALAVDDNGNALATWSQFNGLENDIWANRYNVGVGWEQPILIESGSADALRSEVRIDHEGNGVAVWSQGEHIWANRYVPSDGWGTATPLGEAMGPVSDPALGVDRAGNAMVVWLQADRVWAARYQTKSGWGDAIQIGTNPNSRIRWMTNLRVTVFPDGAAVALRAPTSLWSQSPGPDDSVTVNEYQVERGWDVGRLVGIDAREELVRHRAVDTEGKHVVIFKDVVDGTPTLVLRRFDARAFLAKQAHIPSLGH